MGDRRMVGRGDVLPGARRRGPSLHLARLRILPRHRRKNKGSTRILGQGHLVQAGRPARLMVKGSRGRVATLVAALMAVTVLLFMPLVLLQFATGGWEQWPGFNRLAGPKRFR